MNRELLRIVQDVCCKCCDVPSRYETGQYNHNILCDVSSYWMTLKKREATGNPRRKALDRFLTLGKAMNL
jgi:hypothetical protein